MELVIFNIFGKDKKRWKGKHYPNYNCRCSSRLTDLEFILLVEVGANQSISHFLSNAEFQLVPNHICYQRIFFPNWMFLKFLIQFQGFSAHTPGCVVCCHHLLLSNDQVLLAHGANFSSRLPTPTSTGTPASAYFHTSTIQTTSPLLWQ